MSSITIPDFAAGIAIGFYPAATYLTGYLDEYRISKGIARWTSNFNSPIRTY